MHTFKKLPIQAPKAKAIKIMIKSIGNSIHKILVAKEVSSRFFEGTNACLMLVFKILKKFSSNCSNGGALKIIGFCCFIWIRVRRLLFLLRNKSYSNALLSYEYL